jgi:hypothetical protein
MKSLSERIAYRAEQRAKALAEKNAENGAAPEAAFDATKHAAKNAKTVLASLESLSTEQLTQLAAAEEAGQKRSSVTAAIKAESDKRAAAGSGWSGNS